MDLNHDGISVILPAHRADNYLWESIDSTLVALSNQDLKYEILLMVNGSDSTTIFNEILQRYSPIHVRTFNLGNCGLPMALNSGIHHATYQYIARMDSDDVCIKTRFITANLEWLKQYDFVFSQIKVIGLPEKTNQTFVVGEVLVRQMLRKCCVAHPTMIARKSSLIDLNGYRNLTRSEDYDLWLRALETGKKLFVTSETVISYRVHHGQQTNQLGLAQTHYIDGKLKLGYARRHISVVSFIQALISFLKFLVAKIRVWKK